MAGERFDNIPQGQRYVSQYVPLPLDLMLKSGAMKQDQFNRGIEDVKDTQDLIKINQDLIKI